MAWITSNDVKAYLGLTPFDTVDDAHVTTCVNAATAWLAGLRPDLNPSGSVPGDVKLGLIMVAAGVYDRRGSQGDATVGEWAGPGPVIDSTVMQLCGLGRFHPPVVA